MGKRSDFSRVPRDFYETIDLRCGDQLKPHLPVGVKYWECCAGRLALVDQLSDHAECVIASDKWEGLCSPVEGVHRCDMFGVKKDDVPDEIEMIITNPPWSRTKQNPILHDAIWHLTSLRPTWLLFDADWAHTVQASPFKDICKKVVSVGRVKWIPGSKMTGKDNVAWYFFKHADGPTEFIWR